MIQKELQQLGLSEKEAAVYVALLSSRRGTVQQIAKKAKVKRATTYVILDSLMRLGLASTFSQDKKTFFTPESPQRLRSIVETRIQQLDSQERELQALLPQLREMHQQVGDGPVVEFFEGVDSLKKAVKRVFTAHSKGVVRIFYNNDLLGRFVSEHDRDKLRTIRKRRGITTQVIYTSAADSVPATNNDERIRVSAQEFSTDCDITLYDDKVQIVSMAEDDPSGIIITDAAVYESFVSLFKLAWLGARKKRIDIK